MLSIDTLYEIKPLLDPDMRMTDEEFMIRSLQNIAASIPEYSSCVIIPSDAEVIARKRKKKSLILMYLYKPIKYGKIKYY